MKNPWIKTGKLIEKFRIKLHPGVFLEKEGKKDFWSAGVLTYDKNTGTNYIKIKHLTWGVTPHEAVEKAVKLFEEDK